MNRLHLNLFLSLILVSPLLPFRMLSGQRLPTDNPVERYGKAWTGQFRWGEVIRIQDMKGNSWDEKLNRAQEHLASSGGGVIYFPAGDYRFRENIRLRTGIVLRGAPPLQTEKWNPVVPEDQPAWITDAREARYSLGTRFLFPQYHPLMEGSGRPVESAFKGILLADPSRDHHCGVVHISVDNGHIAFGELSPMQEDYRSGKNLQHYLVYGCILSNTASPRAAVPSPWQHPWQRFTDSEKGAITVFASGQVLIANNRIPESGESNFTMRGYRVYPTRESEGDTSSVVETEVIFDYDNRSGIRVNAHPALPRLEIWSRHREIQELVEEGNHESVIAPGSLARGIDIRENYIFSTGRAAIKAGGDGTFIGYNVIRFKPGVIRPTSDGIKMDGFTNSNRAVEVKGWRWTIEGNDFEVHSNYTPTGIKYNDGEGLMHEAWECLGIRDSRMVHNTGNRYLSFWRVPVRGLLIRGNHIRIYRDFHAIYVNSQARLSSDHFVDLPCEGVKILDNLTERSGIKVIGLNGEGNEIRGNRHAIPGQGRLEDFAGSTIGENTGYRLILEE